MKLRFSRLSQGLFLGAAGGFLALHGAGFVLNPAEAQEKSAIQLELEKLYEQDQREMPEMRLEALPKHTQDGVRFENAAPQAQQVEQAPPKKRGMLDRLPWFRKPSVPAADRPRVVQPQQTAEQQQPTQRPQTQQVAPTQRPGNPTRAQQVFGLPQNAQNTAPRQFVDDDDDDDDDDDEEEVRTSGQPRLLNQQSAQDTIPVQQFQPRTNNRPVMNSQAIPSGQLPQINPKTNTAPTAQAFPVIPPSSLPQAPAIPFEAVETPTAATPTAAPLVDDELELPNLDDVPKDPLPLVKEEQPKAAVPPAPQDFFPDPFTDVSEQEADLNKKTSEIPVLKMDETVPATAAPSTPTAVTPTAPAAVAPTAPATAPGLPLDEAEAPVEAPQVEENPFSGLKLEPPVDVEPAQEPTTKVPAKEAALPQLDPAFEDDFELPTKQADDAPVLPADLPKLERVPDAGFPKLPAAEQGDFSWDEEEARRQGKLRLIAERAGETGLKGFCIVALRDDRDLIDALPAFRSTFNLRTYHFSSLETKIEFDKEPLKYVPAYDGNDPILLSSQSEEREGSLDHALWFRGRLYLFTTAENKELFQRDPALFAAH